MPPQPPLPPPEAPVAARLEKFADRAINLLQTLTASHGNHFISSPTATGNGSPTWGSGGGGGGGSQSPGVRVAVMPKTAITHAVGLAFVFRHKVGALLGVMHERAFLLARRVGADGSVAWSGPVFCRGRAISLGLTAGFLDLRLCLAIRSEEGLREVLRPYIMPGVNAVCLVDMNGNRLRPLNKRGSGCGLQGDDDKLARYYEMEAALLDVSVRGVRFGLDTPLNAAVYGPGVSADDILDCRVPPPVEFQPLYALLDSYAREAGGLRSVASAGSRLSALGGAAHPPHRSPSTSPRQPSLGARSAHGGGSVWSGSTRGGRGSLHGGGSALGLSSTAGSERGSAGDLGSMAEHAAEQPTGAAAELPAPAESVSFKWNLN